MLHGDHCFSAPKAQRSSAEQVDYRESPLHRSRFHHLTSGNSEHKVVVDRHSVPKPARIKPSRLRFSSKQLKAFVSKLAHQKDTWDRCTHDLVIFGTSV